MSTKFDCMITILNKIDRGESVSINSLVNDLEISERSALRYMQTLKTSFPIYYDKKSGSYRFLEGYSLRKPNFSVEEQLAFALARVALGNMGLGFEESLDSLEKKLALRDQPAPGKIILKPQKPSALVKAHLAMIYEAIVNFQKVEIVYSAFYSDEVSTRKVDPYYIFFPEGFWTLRAYCHLREDMRTFAVDRIQSLKVLNEHFFPRNISPEEELSSSFGVWLDGEMQDVTLRFDREIRSYISRKKWHHSQEEKDLRDGRLEVSFRVTGLEDIRHWIYRWIPYVEVVRPRELKDMLKSDLSAALRRI